MLPSVPEPGFVGWNLFCVGCLLDEHECVGVWNPLAPVEQQEPCQCPICPAPDR